MSITRSQTFAAVVVLAFGAAGWAGCSSANEDASADDSAITATNCRIFNNQTSKEMTPDELGKLNDPIANKILAGGTCPGSYTQALAKLKTTDNTDCKDPNGGKQDQGLGSFFVSETAEFAASDTAASKDGFRTVVTKTCEGRNPDEMLFSGFANIDGVSDTSVEMIGKDATTGVYNFYEVLPDNQWVFYGTSADFIGSGYDCGTSGFCKSRNSKKASSPSGKSCASCHISGGLVMKELDSPWLHWTAGHQKGSEAVAKKFPDKLGNQNAGAQLEFEVVRSSFATYSERRVDILAGKGVQELVRPLFCTMDVNLHSGFDSRLMLDPSITAATFILGLADYPALKKAVRQHIVGAPANVDDTENGFTYPTTSGIEGAYTRALQNAKLVDAEFVQDVLNVDFTRPIFSGQRCALVDVVTGKTSAVDAKLATFVGETDPAKRAAIAADIAKSIPSLYADALKGSSKPAEQELLANLTDSAQTADQHFKEAQAFIDACQARFTKAPDGALKDIVTYAAHVRSVMRKDTKGFNGQELLEPGPNGDNKMPFDDLPDNPNALHPKDCTLTLSPTQVK
jgi:hypothetical protein